MSNDRPTIHARMWSPAHPDPVDTPVLLVHGLGVAHRLCAPTARELASLGHLAIAPDLPGFGRSPAGQVADGDVDALADVLAEWMPPAIPTPVIAVGVSFGTQVVARLARRAPDLVSGVVLFSPIVEPSKRRWRSLIPRWQMEQATQSWRLRAIVASDFRRCGIRRAVRTVRSAMGEQPERDLDELAQPVLVARGTRDPLASSAFAETLARRSDHGEVCVVPDAVHAMTFEDPVTSARLIDRFAMEIAPTTPRRS